MKQKIINKGAQIKMFKFIKNHSILVLKVIVGGFLDVIPLRSSINEQ